MTAYSEYNTNFTDLSYLNVVGGASAGIGGGFSWIWDDVNINDLEENQSTQLGGSFGPAWYVGLDTIWLDEHTMPLSGISISGGGGVGADIHIQRPKSYNIVSYSSISNTITWGNNKPKTDKPKTSAKVRCCRACGRPDYICPSPIYY